MEQIQAQAIQTYLENLEYLKIRDPALYSRINSISQLIDSGEVPERYHLEFISEEGQFDIYDSITHTYLYQKKPSSFIQEAIKNSSFDKLNSIDMLHPEVYNIPSPFYIDPKDNALTRSTMMYHNDIFEFIKIFKKSTVYKKKQFKYFEKFIFIGTLLGSHIEPIIKKLNLPFNLIYEYNLEIFRLSLFVTNYAKLAKRCHLMFSIMDDKEQTEYILRQFFNEAIRSNYIVKYYCTNYNIHDYFDRILAISAQRTPLAYSYAKMFESFLKPNFENIPKHLVLNTKKHYNFLKDKPVILIAAGPSLGKNIQWLKENHHMFFVVAIGATIKKLLKEDIIPDMITNADADEIIESQFPNEIREQIKNIPFLSSSATYSKVLEIFNPQNVFLAEVMGAFKNNSRTINGFTVGEVTLSFITTLGANQIYLLGTDLALDQDTGATHISDHEHSTIHDISEEKKELNAFVKDGTYNLASTTLTTKGNFRDKVLTTTSLQKSLMAYNANMYSMIKQDPSLKIYNLSDGVYIDNTIPTQINDLKLSSSQAFPSVQDVIEFLKSHSERGFNKEEQIELKNSIQCVDKLCNEIHRISKLKLKTYNQFTDIRVTALNIINQDLKQFARYFIDRIYLNYFFMMEPYLGYQFNEKIENEANLVKKVKKVWCSQMIQIGEDYKKYILTAIDDSN